MPPSAAPAAALAAAILMAVGAAPVAAQQQGGLTVELNKTEPAEAGGCRAYFLFRNGTGDTFEGFEMSLAVLDGGGVIDSLLAVDAAPLPVARTTLKLFEIPGLACGDISEILLHDITACRLQDAGETDCFPIVTLESRADAALVK
jgi:hypothetical protein